MRLTLTGIDVAFGDRSVLSGLDLQIEPSEAVALVGPSGVGKTTLLSVVAGMRRPDAGNRHVADGTDDGIAWVFQTSPVLMRRSALANVALGARASGCDRATSSTRAHEALATLGIGDLATTRLFRLSGGERQRVVIARALAARADLVIADEPTASLDPATKEAVCGALVAVARAGGSVLVATHDPEVAGRCDRILLLRDGRLHLAEPVASRRR